MIALIALAALQAVSASFCLSNCGPGSPIATRTPLGDYISEIDTSRNITRNVPNEGDIQIKANLGADSCGYDADDDGNKCEEVEPLCDANGQITCTDCNTENSCLIEWVNEMRENADDTDGYTSGSELCLKEDDLQAAQEWCDSSKNLEVVESCEIGEECLIGFAKKKKISGTYVGSREYYGTYLGPGQYEECRWESLPDCEDAMLEDAVTGNVGNICENFNDDLTQPGVYRKYTCD